ncbi:MAG: Tol-Pal system beta propeller repeat protein TolB [Thiothrix nivea]|nr:MAG: Tol-Pal system beta propeller repeat protein TolB [Thiothrix nivea]
MKHPCRLLFNVLLLLVAGFMLSATARAELVIRITEGVSDGLPIMIVPFEGTGVSRIIEDDLRRSGRFNLVNPARAGQPMRFRQPFQPTLLKNAGAEYVVTGRLNNGLEFELLNAVTGARVASYLIPPHSSLRSMAHKAADQIYQRLTGQRGAFDTRIAYVSASGPPRQQIYRLIVSDADGFNPRTVMTSDKPVMSPTWSPNGRQLAYVSFESGRSAIYVQNLLTGEARVLASGEGMSGAPAWSPDGRRIAMSLSKEDNADIYVVSATGGETRRITRSRGIDTEPAWANAMTLIYTSDQGGKPQLYRTSANGGDGSRLTFNGSENSAASVVGNSVAMVRQNGNVSHIALMNAASKASTLLSRGGRYDESPSLAPNGSMVIYSTEERGRGVLAIVSSNGKARQILSAQNGHVRDPAWSPYIN